MEVEQTTSATSDALMPDDDGLEQMAVKLSFNCPISLCRIQTPVKALRCKVRIPAFLELNFLPVFSTSKRSI